MQPMDPKIHQEEGRLNTHCSIALPEIGAVMNGKRDYGNAADANGATPGHNSDTTGIPLAGLKNDLPETKKTTMVIHLPDGRIITYTRHLPRLPLGL